MPTSRYNTDVMCATPDTIQMPDTPASPVDADAAPCTDADTLASHSPSTDTIVDSRKSPPLLAVGKHLALRSVHEGARRFRCSLRAFSGMLTELRVPLVAVGGCRYYNELTLEIAIFALTYFGSPGLAMPGSDAKNRKDPMPVHLPDDWPTPATIDRALDAYIRTTRVKAEAARYSTDNLLRKSTQRALGMEIPRNNGY